MAAAELEIFAHAHMAEQLAGFRAMHHAGAGDLRRRQSLEVLPGKADRAAVRHEPGDGVEQRGLAGAVEPDDGDEFVLLHV